MHIATCFDSKKSSSGYSINHSIDTSCDSAHFEIPKCALSHDVSLIWVIEWPDDDSLESKHVAICIIEIR